jgi:dTDP-glucose 4,6-dehydratase
VKVLITGCFGFIGFNFLTFLLNNYSKEFEIYCIDSLETTCSLNNKNILEKKELKNVKVFNEKIQNINRLNLQNIDLIVNFAAETHVDNSITHPEKFVNSNITGLVNLLKFSLNNNVNKIIHLSTDEVYGSKTEGSFVESDILNPSSPYSASKASAEHFCNAFSKTYGLNIIQLRPGNNYGIYQQPEKMIPFSIANLLNGNNIEVYGDGRNIRHWLHVDDTSKAIMKLIESELKSEIFNIGSGYYLSNLELSKKIVNLLDMSQDRIKFVEDRPGHDFRYSTDFTKLTKLDWEPKADFDTELQKIVEWYSRHRSWWEVEYNNVINNKRVNRTKLKN